MKLKGVTHFICFIGLVVITATFYFHFISKEYRWSFQPGSDASFMEIRRFYNLIENPGRATFPGKLVVAQTYLTGPFIFTAVAAHAVEFLVKIQVLPAYILSNNDSLFIFSFRYMNLLFYALAVGLAYLCLYSVMRNALLGFLLTASIFMFNNAALNISMSEVDFYLLFSGLLFFYTSFRIIDNPHSNINYVLFGFAFIISAATKINTPLFLNIPGILLLLLLIRKHIDAKKIMLLFGTIVMLSFIFFIRWYAYPGTIIPYLTGVFEEGKMWFVLAAGGADYSFYHNALFHNYYLPDYLMPFISFFINVVFVLLAFMIYRQRYNIQPKFIFLLTIFIIHSAGLIWGPKFYRYGCLMPFYYLTIIGFGLAELKRLDKQRLLTGISVSVVIAPLVYSIANFNHYVKNFNNEQSAFEIVKLKPRQWIYDNIKQGAKIARTGRFGSPPINNNKYDLTPRFLKMSYGNPDRIITKIPPEKEEILKLTDVILLSNKAFYERPYFIEKLVEERFDVAEDSVEFIKYVHQLNTIAPGITHKLSAKADTAFSEEVFFAEILSPMWKDNYSFQQSLEQYFYHVTADDTLANTLVDLTINILFGSNDSVLNYGYAELINSRGKMMYVYAWKQFYNDIDDTFETVRFESDYEYKGVWWQKIIIVNESCLKES